MLAAMSTLLDRSRFVSTGSSVRSSARAASRLRRVTSAAAAAAAEATAAAAAAAAWEGLTGASAWVAAGRVGLSALIVGSSPAPAAGARAGLMGGVACGVFACDETRVGGGGRGQREGREGGMGDGLGLASATTTRNEGGARAHRRVSRAHAERIDGKFPRGLSDRGLDPVRLVVVHIGGRRSAAQRSADPIFESILGPTRTFLNCHGRVARGAPKFHRGPRAPVRSSSKPSRAGRSSTGRSFRYRHTTSTPPLSLSRCRPRRRARVAPRRLRVTPFRRHIAARACTYITAVCASPKGSSSSP